MENRTDKRAAQYGTGLWLTLGGLVVWMVFALSGPGREEPLKPCPPEYRILKARHSSAEMLNIFAFYAPEGSAKVRR